MRSPVRPIPSTPRLIGRAPVGLRVLWAAALIVALLGPAAGCDSGDRAISPAAVDLPPSDPREVASIWIDAAIRVIVADAHPGRVNAAEIEEVAVRVAEEPDLGTWDAVWLQRVRAQHGPVFVDAEGPSGAGRAVLDQLAELPSQGLVEEDFQVRAITDARLAFERDRETVVIPDLSGPSRQRIVEQLVQAQVPPSPRQLARELLSPGAALHDEALAESVAELVTARQRRAARLGRLEILLADAAIRFALEMRVAQAAGRGAALPWTLRVAGTPVPPPELGHGDFGEPATAQLEVRKLAELFEALAAVRGDRAASTRLLAGLLPQTGDYAALQEVYRQFLGVVAKGGWAPLPEVALGNPEMAALLDDLVRERLRVEGFLDAEASWASPVEVDLALRRARERYGLPLAVGLDSALFAQLNVPVEARLHQIAYNLQRWRRLGLDANQTYLIVNLPSHEGYVVRNGARLLRFDIRASKANASTVPSFSGHVSALLVDGDGDAPRVELRTVNPSPIRLMDLSHATCADCYGFDRAPEVANRLLQLTGQGHLDVRKVGRRAVISLNPRLPLHVTYFTTTTATDRTVRFHPDPFGEDGDVLALGRLATARADAGLPDGAAIP